MSYVPLFLALASGILGASDKLRSPSPGKKIVGLLSVAVLVVALGWQGWQSFVRDRSIERLKVFTQSGLKDVDEASGGVFDPDRQVAYVVDDDESKLFRFSFVASEEKYRLRAEIELFDDEGGELKGSDVEDFEAISLHQDKLYAITSHSNKKSGGEKLRRQLLYEIQIEEGDRGIVTRSASLRQAIYKRLNDPVGGHTYPLEDQFRDEEDRNEIMNIEGFTISSSGVAYIGFRSPLIDEKYALVLRTPLEQLFTDDPEFEVLLFNLLIGERLYAITDLAFDVDKKTLLILGNSKNRVEMHPPALWTWETQEEEGIQIAMLVKQGFMVPPEHFRAKPEAIIVSPDGTVGIFADAEGYGGQRVFSRRELGLDPL